MCVCIYLYVSNVILCLCHSAWIKYDMHAEEMGTNPSESVLLLTSENIRIHTEKLKHYSVDYYYFFKAPRVYLYVSIQK